VRRNKELNRPVKDYLKERIKQTSLPFYIERQLRLINNENGGLRACAHRTTEQ
jgi:hypothetical protein